MLKLLVDATLLHNKIWKGKKQIDAPPYESRRSPALHYAVFHGLYDMTKLLLKFGANVNALGYENNHEMTPAVVLAAWEGGNDILKLLLENGADPNMKSSNNVSALSTAKKHNKPETVEMLLKYGAME